MIDSRKSYTISVMDKTVQVWEWGEQNLPVIFCLHGLGSTSLSFIEIAEKLKNRFRVISIDLPGHGKTEAFSNQKEYEMPFLIEWLSVVLDKLKVDKFYSLSHSWGSSIALYFLASFPEKVKGTILIDGGYYQKSQQKMSMEEEMDFYAKDFEEYRFPSWENYIKTVKKEHKRWSPLLEIASRDLMIEEGEQLRWHATGRTARWIIESMFKFETKAIYPQLASSIVLLQATLPEGLMNWRNKMAKEFQEETSSIVKPIANTTHMLHWDFPEVVVNEILFYWVNK